MDAKKLLDKYHSVAGEIYCELDAIKAFGVVRFVADKWDAFLKKNFKSDTRELGNESNDLWADVYDLGFMHGYLIGQMFDLNDSEVAKDLKSIRADFVKNSGLKFTPRKKAA